MTLYTYDTRHNKKLRMSNKGERGETLKKEKHPYELKQTAQRKRRHENMKTGQRQLYRNKPQSQTPEQSPTMQRLHGKYYRFVEKTYDNNELRTNSVSKTKLNNRGTSSLENTLQTNPNISIGIVINHNTYE